MLGRLLTVSVPFTCRYIHEVLQMYEGGESSDSGAASDSSWDDPEHKNMFDHL